MRATSLFLLTLAAVGCAEPEIRMSHISTLESQTRGVVLYDDGQRGHAAMWDTTCEFDTLNGWIIDDHDLPTAEEEVVDTWDGVVLGTSGRGAHLVQDRDSDVVGSHIAHAQLWEGGVVTFRLTTDGCFASWGADSRVAIPDAACDPGAELATDRDDGNVVVTTGEDTLVVDEDGSTSLGEAADLVAWDRVTGLAYLAQEGGSAVWAIDEAGVGVWTADVGGPVRDLDDMGRRGAAAVMVERDGRGALMVLDGLTGEPRTEHETPDAEADVTVSDDGRTLGLVLADQVFFYDVTEEGEEPKDRKTLGVEDNDPVFSD